MQLIQFFLICENRKFISGQVEFFADNMAFTSSNAQNKPTVRFKAGIASTMEERLNHVYKIEEDDDGNVINSFNSRASFFLV